MSRQRYKRGMHPYYRYHTRRAQEIKQRSRKWLIVAISIIFVSAALIGTVLYYRPLPSIAAKKEKISSIKVDMPTVAWPEGAQSSFGTVDSGVLASSSNQTPRPTASTAKLITALAVLEKRPLKKGEQGPTIPITQADEAIYNDYFAKDGSLAQVAAGQNLTEYQMLQGVLLPSANNYADTLAIWAFGSLEGYQKAASGYVKKLGMTHTTIGADASGFSPSTVSTATDLTKLAVTAMKHPVIAEIVSQSEVNLPVAGVKKNTNWLLGTDGVVGLKTGNTDQAGGVYIFAVEEILDSRHRTTMVGVVQGRPTLFETIIDARNLIRYLKPQFVLTTVIKKDEIFATYKAPWGAQVAAKAEHDVKVVRWAGEPVTVKTTLSNANTALPAGSPIGLVKMGSQSSQLILSDRLESPSWQWRLWRNSSL